LNHNVKEEIPFVNSTVNWMSRGGHPKRKLTKHEESNRHRNAQEKHVCYLKTVKRSNVVQQIKDSAAKITEQNVARNRDYIKNLAKTLYFIVRKKWAHSDNVEELIRFLANDLKVSCFKDFLDSASFDATYLSTGSVDQLLSCISNKIEAGVLDEIQSQNCLGIMADETCDEDNLQQISYEWLD